MLNYFQHQLNPEYIEPENSKNFILTLIEQENIKFAYKQIKSRKT